MQWPNTNKPNVAIYTRAAIYTRVSTHDKAQTTENQLLPLRDYCAGQTWDVPVEYTDNISAVKRRPGYEQMLKDALTGKVDVIVVWKMDRLFRSMSEFVKVTQLLCEKQVRLVIPSQQIDTDQRTPLGTLIMTLLAAFAEFERELTSERVAAGMSRAKAQGWKKGKPGRKITVDLIKVHELRSQGLSIRQIATKLGVSKSTIGGLTLDASINNRSIGLTGNRGICELCNGVEGSHDPLCPVGL